MVLDEGIVAQLMDMGFALEGCKKAVFNTNNSGIEPAMNWVMEHMGDPGKSELGHGTYGKSELGHGTYG